MKNGQATEQDDVPVEAWKASRREGIGIMWELMKKIMEKETTPDRWRESTVIPLYKEKGDAQECGN